MTKEQRLMYAACMTVIVVGLRVIVSGERAPFTHMPLSNDSDSETENENQNVEAPQEASNSTPSAEQIATK